MARSFSELSNWVYSRRDRVQLAQAGDEGIPLLRFDPGGGEEVHLGHAGCSAGQLEQVLESFVCDAHGAVQFDDAHARANRFEDSAQRNGRLSRHAPLAQLANSQSSVVDTNADQLSDAPNGLLGSLVEGI